MHARQAVLNDNGNLLIVTFNGTDYVIREIGNPNYTREQLAEIKENLDAKFYLQK